MRPWLFVLGWLAAAALFAKPIGAAISLALNNEWYTHLLLAAPVSVGLLVIERDRVFRERCVTKAVGLPVFALVTIICWITLPWESSRPIDGELWRPMLALVTVWILLFFYWNGARAARAAVFPLGFLLLSVPVPSSWMEVAVRFLQQGSAEATHTLFNGIGIPVVRHGFQFDLPGLAIEVAEECSGVHSAVALLIASTLAAHFFLRSTWKQILFVLLAVPIAILKNAIRIVLISALTLYVDPAIIDGPLHHQGGPVFAVVGLTLLAPLLYVLWKTEVYSHPDPSLPQR